MVTRSGPVIEDEAVVALFLSDILCDLNDEVCAVAASGREGLDLAARYRPALAMVDIRLKGDFDDLHTARSPLAVLNKAYTPEQLEAALADAFAQA